jgi:hypothetical protein
MTEIDRWARLSRRFDPGRHIAEIASMPRDIDALCTVVHGLLVHSDWLDAYGLGQKPSASRSTLPIADRLEAILAIDKAPFREKRAPERRSIGTCRDFALMLASFLRCQGVPARLRCGFASYFSRDWEDHWLCEYWDARAHDWRLADAQLDDVLQNRCGIDFDPADVPRARFKFAGEAWRACRIAPSDAGRFGHGDVKGRWLISVNVRRDHLALNDRETSVWDRWREAPEAARRLSQTDLLALDSLSAKPEQPLVESAPAWLA